MGVVKVTYWITKYVLTFSNGTHIVIALTLHYFVYIFSIVSWLLLSIALSVVFIATAIVVLKAKAKSICKRIAITTLEKKKIFFNPKSEVFCYFNMSLKVTFSASLASIRFIYQKSSISVFDYKITFVSSQYARTNT